MFQKNLVIIFGSEILGKGIDALAKFAGDIPGVRVRTVAQRADGCFNAPAGWDLYIRVSINYS